jgi:hypothetical protein
MAGRADDGGIHQPELILKDTDWQYEDELTSLKEDLRLIADQLRADETKKMVNAIEVRLIRIRAPADNADFARLLRQRNLKRQLAEPVEVTLSQPKADMWDSLLISFKTALEKAEETYMAKAKSKVFFAATLALTSASTR